MNEEVFNINKVSLAIGSLATQAMLYEISCFPSPGLISPISNGSHTDMNYYTFIDSTSVLSRYLPLFVQEGFSEKSCKDIFRSIRLIGVEAEKDMFAITKGINTHKGMLFLIGTTCAAIGKAIYEKKKFNEVHYIIKEMTKGIVQEELALLQKKDNLSHGEKLYFKYRTEGIRGEVEKGIPTVFNVSLDFYRNDAELSINDRLVHTLIGIMQVCDDSTIIHRHSQEVLEEVKEKAKAIIVSGGMKTPCGREKINSLCNEFIERNISPGGSADLLGVTVFIYLVEQYMSAINI